MGWGGRLEVVVDFWVLENLDINDSYIGKAQVVWRITAFTTLKFFLKVTETLSFLARKRETSNS